MYFEGKVSPDSSNLRLLLQCCERWQQPALQPFAWVRSNRKCTGNGQKLSESDASQDVSFMYSRIGNACIQSGVLDHAGVAVVAKQIDTVLAYNGSVHLPKSLMLDTQTKKPDWQGAFLQW